MLHRIPEYRRRVLQKSEERKGHAKQKEQEASQDARIAKIESYIKAMSQQIASYTDETTPQNKGKIHREIAEIVALILAVVVGLVAIGVSNHDADGQREVMTGQLQEMKTEERAWLNPISMKLDKPIEETKPIEYSLVYQNTGKQPGLDVNIQIEYRYIDRPNNGRWLDSINEQNNTVCDRTRVGIGKMVIYPSADKGLSVSFRSSIPLDMEPFINGRKSLVFLGCIAYNTEGARHNSAFCFWMEPALDRPSDQWNFKFCETGNTAD